MAIRIELYRVSRDEICTYPKVSRALTAAKAQLGELCVALEQRVVITSTLHSISS